MIKYIIILGGYMLLLFACQQTKSIDLIPPTLISDTNKSAGGAYFTSDESGNTVLVWTEKDEQQAGSAIMKYARIRPDGQLAKVQNIPTSKGTRLHNESMNKLAFKSDGTMVAVYGKRTPHPKNRFAGALYYTQSFDGGKDWTVPKYLHVGDTTIGKSRSFFDLERLANGEIGAIWLDSRNTKKRGDGSSLFFAKTKKRDGFLSDKTIGTSTCECCRTDIYLDDAGSIHVAYRDIYSDSIRDMSYIISTDNGESFSEPTRMYPDNWMIRGCPHTGPSLGQTANNLYAAWYTEGSGSGLFLTASEKGKKQFKNKKLISKAGNHPQLIVLDSDKLLVVFDESEAGHTGHHHGAKETIQLDMNKRSVSMIKAQIWEAGSPQSEHWVSEPDREASFPVIRSLDAGVVIAWMQEMENGGTGIYYRTMEL